MQSRRRTTLSLRRFQALSRSHWPLQFTAKLNYFSFGLVAKAGDWAPFRGAVSNLDSKIIHGDQLI
jgi:hypothetical protein